VDVAYLSRFGSGGQQVQCVAGDSGRFSFAEGDVFRFEDTYCRRMVEGSAPSLVPDVSAEPRMQDLAGADALGAYLGVPIRLFDGRIYGSLCCACKAPQPGWDSKDEAYLQLLADSLGALLTAGSEADAEPVDDDREMRLSLWFTGVRRAPTSARASLSTLEPFLTQPLLQRLRLLITELTTNCIRHAGVDEHSAMGLTIHLGEEQLRGVVSDAGPGFARPDVIEPRADEDGGFGLVILDTISDRWGLDRDELFRVWFEVDLHTTFDAP
jgi:anti-sigma regulatory factor (Ser/Thr protein kinase)